MNADLDPIIAELVQLRSDTGTMQKDFANGLGVGPSSLSAYENGRVAPQLNVVRVWASILGKKIALVDDSAGDQRKVDDVAIVRLDRYQLALAMGMLLAAAKDARTDRLAKDLESLADVFAESLGQGR